MNYLLSFMIFLPLIGMTVATFAARDEIRSAKNTRNVRFLISLFELILCFLMLRNFTNKETSFQFKEKYEWFNNFFYHIGIDGFSALLLFAVITVFFICAISDICKKQKMAKEYSLFMLWLESMIIGLLCSLDSFLLLFFFTALAVPLFFIIGIWGNDAEGKSNLKMLVLNITGSIFLMISVFLLSVKTNNFSLLEAKELSAQINWAIFAFCFSGAAIICNGILFPVAAAKTLRPFSPVSAGIVLNVIPVISCIYVFIRVIAPFFAYNFKDYFLIFSFLCLFLCFFFIMSAYGNQEIHKTVNRYNSVLISIIFLGLFSANASSVNGSIYFTLNYVFVLSGLMLSMDIIHERSQSYLLAEIGGLFASMPIFSKIFLLLIFASFFIPLTGGFNGLVFIAIETFPFSKILGLCLVFMPLFIAPFMFRLYQILINGNTNEKTLKYKDVETGEIISLSICLLFVFALGIFSCWFVSFLSNASLKLGATIW